MVVQNLAKHIDTVKQFGVTLHRGNQPIHQRYKDAEIAALENWCQENGHTLTLLISSLGKRWEREQLTLLKKLLNFAIKKTTMRLYMIQTIPIEHKIETIARESLWC